MLSRRALLATTVCIPVGACAGFTVDKGIAALVEYGTALYQGGRSMWLQLQASPLLSFVSDQVKSDISTTGRAIGAALNELKAAQSTAAAQPIVAKLGTYVRAVLAAFAKIPGLPPTIAVLIAAVQTVLPVLESLVGIGIATFQQIQDATQAKNTLLAAPQ